MEQQPANNLSPKPQTLNTKVNVLHWHAVDNQSFPLPTPRQPNLSRLGAFSQRERYSVSDVDFVVEYARQRAVRWWHLNHEQQAHDPPKMSARSSIIRRTIVHKLARTLCFLQTSHTRQSVYCTSPWVELLIEFDLNFISDSLFH